MEFDIHLMKFSGQEIRTLRQRLGWSQAEFARRMGTDSGLVKKWELGMTTPDSEALNQLCYLRNHLENSSDQVAQTPLMEKEITERGVGQLTRRDLLNENQ